MSNDFMNLYVAISIDSNLISILLSTAISFALFIPDVEISNASTMNPFLARKIEFLPS